MFAVAKSVCRTPSSIALRKPAAAPKTISARPSSSSSSASRSVFFGAPKTSKALSFSAQLAGTVLGPISRIARGVARVFRLDVEANRKRGMGCTLQGTRRRRTRVSGFRTRMRTANGRKVLKARRDKGRKKLCGAHNYKK